MIVAAMCRARVPMPLLTLRIFDCIAIGVLFAVQIKKPFCFSVLNTWAASPSPVLFPVSDQTFRRVRLRVRSQGSQVRSLRELHRLSSYFLHLAYPQGISA